MYFPYKKRTSDAASIPFGVFVRALACTAMLGGKEVHQVRVFLEEFDEEGVSSLTHPSLCLSQSLFSCRLLILMANSNYCVLGFFSQEMA